MIEVIPVSGDPRLERLFCRYGVDTSIADRRRQAKFYDAEADLLSNTSNVFARRGISQFWLVQRDNVVLGRVGASVDTKLFDSKDTPGLGFVGFYEAVNEDEVAKLLLDTAIDYLRGKGCITVWGPIDFSIYLNYRFQTNMFSSRAYVGEPRNPSYYVNHFINQGFEVLHNWESHKLGLNTVDQMIEDYRPDYVRAIHLGYRHEPFTDYSDDNLLKLLWRLIQNTYRGMPGFIDLSFCEFERQFCHLSLIADRKTSFFLLDPQSKVIGFNIIFKDRARALRAMKGRVNTWSKIKYKMLERDGPSANACHTAIEYRALKQAMIDSARMSNQPLSLAKSLFCCSAIEVRKNPSYKEVIIALLRSDTPNIHLSRGYSCETRLYSLYSLQLG